MSSKSYKKTVEVGALASAIIFWAVVIAAASLSGLVTGGF